MCHNTNRKSCRLTKFVLMLADWLKELAFSDGGGGGGGNYMNFVVYS